MIKIHHMKIFFNEKKKHFMLSREHGRVPRTNSGGSNLSITTVPLNLMPFTAFHRHDPPPHLKQTLPAVV